MNKNNISYNFTDFDFENIVNKLGTAAYSLENILNIHMDYIKENVSYDAYQELSEKENQILCDKLGISISLHSSEPVIVEIVLNTGLPHRKSSKSSIYGSQTAQAIRYFVQHNAEIINHNGFPLENGMCLIHHIFPITYQRSKIYDHDNYALKKIIDALIPDFVISDNGMNLAITQLSSKKDVEQPITHIYIGNLISVLDVIKNLTEESPP